MVIIIWFGINFEKLLPVLYFLLFLSIPISESSYSFQDRDGYWKVMQKYVGADVTSMVTLPVLIFEPMTMLQKMAEVCVICKL